MNSNVSSFRPNPVQSISSLRALSTETSDVAEGSLRLFMVLCLLASLVLGGWHANAGRHEDAAAASFALPAVTKLVPSVPTLPIEAYSVPVR